MTHTCTAGTPEANGTMCGANADGGIPDAAVGSICKGGMCVSGQCGDGVVEPGEQCDFGAGNGPGTGCENNCAFSCTLSPNSCVTTDPCGGTNTCTAFTFTEDAGSSPGQKCETGMPLTNGTACSIGGNTGTCQSGVCKTSLCGNDKVDPGEQCDWGTANNVAGSGCNPDCTFSCTTSPDSCPGSALCSASPQKCTVVQGPSGTPAGDNGQKCEAQTALAECASCGSGVICVNDVCKAHVCGDGCLTPPETCDPPNSQNCNSMCQLFKCGNGVLEGTEQCDDGNTTNLDGCDQYCNFEQEHRATKLTISNAATPGISSCKANALGAKAITGLGLGVIQGDLNTSVANGSTNVMLKFMSASTPTPPGMPTSQTPADLSGTTGNVILGSLSGTPQDADGGTYSGTSDLDWWYTVAPNSIDGSRNPLSQLAAVYNAKQLSTPTPGNISLYLLLQGSPADLSMWNASLVASLGANSPIETSTGAPPGHLASEHDEALLTSKTGGTFATSTKGELCGNVTAQSLQTVPVPTSIATGGSTACSQGYKVGVNSLLDVLIGGCTYLVPVVNVTQPDQFQAPMTGAGTLSASGTTKVVDTCKQGTTVVPLATCLPNVGYSADFTFNTDRVIVK
jgi:cysteine-rich repeat protein